MLGDSFTFGYGVNVDETFPEILESDLAKKLNKNVEVINAGFAGGITLDEYYLFTKEHGLKYQPNLIVVNIFLGNDIEDLKNHDWQQVDEKGLPTKIDSNTTFISPEGFMLEKENPTNTQRRISGVLGIVNRLFCDHIYICKIIVRPSVDQIVFKGVYQDKNLNLYRSLLSNLPEDLERNWQVAERLISAINDLAVKNGAGFMIVNIPIREQIYDPKGILKNKQLNTQRLGEFLKTANIAKCDLINVLAEKPEESYFKYDAHFTKTGNLLAAQGIEMCLKDLGIL